MRLAGVMLLALLVSGCTYEKMVESKMAGRPTWIDQPTTTRDEVMTFVGMGIARNVLDERTARDQALADAREQIANTLMTDVQSSTLDVVEREGAAHMGEDEADETFRATAQTMASQAIRGARQTENYWEKWKIREGIFSGAFTRIKYWVRVDVPRNLYVRLMEDMEK
jgi:hypothetical protein